MKRIAQALTLAAVVSMAFAPQAVSQSVMPLKIYGGVGFNLPIDPSEFKDSANTGYHGFVGVGFPAAPGLEIIGKVEYASFGYEDFPTVVDGGKFKTFMYGADARFSVGAPAVKFKPFVFAGIGYASVDRVDITPSGTNPVDIVPSFFNQQDELYYNFGGGLELAGGPMFTLFIQAKYVSISTEPASMKFVPISVGVKMF